MDAPTKPPQSSVFLVLVFILVGFVIAGAVAFVVVRQGAHHDNVSMDGPIACETTGSVISVRMTADAFVPSTITANRCDVIDFVNESNNIYQPALGEHDDHTSYPGFSETAIDPGGSMQVTLSQTGTYRLHEHFGDKLVGVLTIR